MDSITQDMKYRYVTFKQCQEEGGKVKKGEEASMVVFWKWIEEKDPETEEVKQIPFLRYYNVFHIDQCEGLKVRHTKVIFEYEHGDAKVKQNLQMLLTTVQEGDNVITLEVSRLHRSTKQLCESIEVIKEKHLRLMIVSSITIYCRNGELDCMSAAFQQMAGVFAEPELQMMRVRVKSGSPMSRQRER